MIFTNVHISALQKYQYVTQYFNKANRITDCNRKETLLIHHSNCYFQHQFAREELGIYKSAYINLHPISVSCMEFTLHGIFYRCVLDRQTFFPQDSIFPLFMLFPKNYSNFLNRRKKHLILSHSKIYHQNGCKLQI